MILYDTSVNEQRVSRVSLRLVGVRQEYEYFTGVACGSSHIRVWLDAEFTRAKR